jgi:NAD(P)-dependent dehydrogenase (short-subunit alcohol dehydrogenase family)
MGFIARRVFVSGGSGDLGAAVVRDLAAAGHLVRFQFSSAGQRAGELAALPGVTAFRSDYSDVAALADNDMLPPSPGFDVLVCCSGVNPEGHPVAETPMKALQHTLSVNLLSAFRLTQLCLPAMVSGNWGRIVYLSSIYGDVAGPMNSPYNISKHALRGLCRSVVADYPGSGVTANEILAGPVKSKLLAQITADRAEKLKAPADKVESGLIRRIPVRRLAEPSDVVNAVRFLVSEESSYLTGSSLTLDGGLLSVR